MSEKPELQKLFSLVRLFEMFQSVRIALNNKIFSFNANDEMLGIINRVFDQVKTSEELVQKWIKDEVKDVEIYSNFLVGIKGLGPVLSAKLIYRIKDIERFPTVAKLWRYAGLGVVDGKAERMVKGQKGSYNTKFKALMYNIGVSLLRSGSKYRMIYDNAKNYYTTNRDWTKLHVHLAAMRKMEKIFLAHVWEVWRELEGLPVREPYAMEYLGHTTKLEPEEFIEAPSKLVS